MILFAIAAAFGAEPRYELAWQGRRAELIVVPPVGEHLAVDAPFTIALDWESGHIDKSAIGVGSLRFRGEVRGHRLTGEVRASLCTDDGAQCRPIVARLRGDVDDAPMGRIELVVGPTFDTSAFQADADGAAAEAFAAAKASGRPVLLDFTAVWCPPCNQLALEVLHGAPRPPVLDRFVVAQLDVDDPSSWAVKDRYAIGGYPTVVVADPDGAERGRFVGYTTREDFVAWLGEMDADTLRTQLAAGPAAVTPGRAGQIALALHERGDDPGPWLARAADAPDLDAHRARFAVSPSVSEARWLATNWPGNTSGWAWAAVKTADPELRRTIVAAIEDHPAEGRAHADELDLLASLEPDEVASRRLRAQAAGALAAALTGDLVADRPWLGNLADLRAGAGDVDGALEGLEAATLAFPGDPTFLLAGARIANEAGRFPTALALADRGLAVAWGDNQLRVAIQRARALVGLHRADEAKAFVDATLAAHPAPPDGVDVRTNRYRKQLTDALSVE